MSIKETFEEVAGPPPFIMYEEGELPEYVISMSPHSIYALIDLDKFNREVEFKSFKLTIPFEEGYLTVGDECFNVKYVKDAMKILEPDEYATFEEDIKEKNESGNVLLLKKANYGIIIAPLIKKYKKTDLQEIALTDVVKKAPSSVNVL